MVLIHSHMENIFTVYGLPMIYNDLQRVFHIYMLFFWESNDSDNGNQIMKL